MPNLGLTPLDPESPVSQLRATLGDTSWVELDPPSTEVDGYREVDYAQYGDAQLAAALEVAGGNVPRAAGNMLLTFAIELEVQSKMVRTDDLTIDLRGRGNSLRLMAEQFFAQADALDDAEAGDFFGVAAFPGAVDDRVRPEATPWPYGNGWVEDANFSSLA